MRCRNCHSPLVTVPWGPDYISVCGSCGAYFHVVVTQIKEPTVDAQKIESIRGYMMPGSY